MEAPEFLAALLSFGMGAQAAKAFAKDREAEGGFDRHWSGEPPGPIAVAALSLFSEHGGESSDGAAAAGFSHA